MWVGEHLLPGGLGTGVFAPVLGKGDVEALRAGVAVDLCRRVDARLLRALEIGHVGEQKAAVIRGVFAQGEPAVDVHVVHRNELAVLVHEAGGADLEVLFVLGGPPIVQVAVAVELRSLIVEAVRELMADDAADMAVVHREIGLLVVKRGLQNAGRKVNVVHAGVVIGVDGGRGHAPLEAVDRLADLVQLAVTFKRVGALLIAKGIRGGDGERRVVAPVLRVADLVGDGMQFRLGFELGIRSHPLQGIDVAVHGRLDVVNHLERPGLIVGAEELLYIDLSERLAELRIDLRRAAFPARLLLGLAFQLRAVEMEVFRVEGPR